MANIIPFRAVRPRADLAERIAALPYDVYNRKEAREAVKGDDYTFLRIDRPETQFPEGYDMYAPEVYEKAREMLGQMIEDGFFVQEEKAAYYVYELIMDGRSQVGIGACASVDDYDSQVIKKHENTRADKEADRIRHVDVCSAQTGPIFLAYRRREEIEREVSRAMAEKPVYDFTEADGIAHRLWVIDEAEAVERIRNAFLQVDAIYIADGHHRCASAVRVSKKRRAAFPDYTGKEEFNYFLSVLFPDDQLMIMDYNRIVKPGTDFDESSFLDRVKESFALEKWGKSHISLRRRARSVCITGMNGTGLRLMTSAIWETRWRIWMWRFCKSSFWSLCLVLWIRKWMSGSTLLAASEGLRSWNAEYIRMRWRLLPCFRQISMNCLRCRMPES